MIRKGYDLSPGTLNPLHMMGLPNRALEPISRSWSFCANIIELDPAQDPVQATIPSELRGCQPRKGLAEATILRIARVSIGNENDQVS